METVLNLMRLNTPQYFSIDEEKDFHYYLENKTEYYFVLEIDGVIVGCGGFNFSEDKTIGKISWDILHPDFHGKSLGSILLDYRINELKKFKQVQLITVRTSQQAYGFYEKRGFRVIEIVKDYWADGFDLYRMEYTSKSLHTISQTFS